jgi:hypothetical protein
VQCRSAAEAGRQVACANGAGEQLRAREPRLSPNPGPTHELRLGDEGDAEDAASGTVLRDAIDGVGAGAGALIGAGL